jgi:hypothetical protein
MTPAPRAPSPGHAPDLDVTRHALSVAGGLAAGTLTGATLASLILPAAMAAPTMAVVQGVGLAAVAVVAVLGWLGVALGVGR